LKADNRWQKVGSIAGIEIAIVDSYSLQHLARQTWAPRAKAMQHLHR
jgi:hypothetical protein